MADFARESGHWYRLDGAPAYTILGKNGKERPTTLRDARNHGLVPSVTTIIQCAAKPGLENWKQEQMLLAALTLPRQEGEYEADWLERVRTDSKEQARRAAERGTQIHAAIEKHFRGEAPDADYWDHVAAARTALAVWCGEQEWLPERSFCHAGLYGGKVDLHSREWLVDCKSKEFTASAPPKLYDEHFMQLAAYRRGLGIEGARCGILFVSASAPGLARFFEVGGEDLQRGLAMFDALLGYWMAKNKV